MLFVNRLSPFIWHIRFSGHEIGVRWYGLSYLLGFILAYLFFQRAASRGEIAGFNPEDVDSLVVRLVVGVMVGGRLGFVVQHPVRLLHEPLFLIAIWEGGMAFFGGLAGVMIGIWTYARKHGISFLAMTDVCAQPAALALGIGRIANFVNGELYGRPTGAAWGVVFPATDPQQLPRHPSQLYEMTAHLLLFVVLLLLYRRWVGHVRPGAISFLFLIGYGLTRWLTDFFREDETYWGPFSTGQWFSLLIALIGAVCLYRWWQLGRTSGTPVSGTGGQQGKSSKSPESDRAAPE